MKLVKQAFEKDASGLTVLVPQDKEDLWQLYNLIQKGDEVKLSTTRNVKIGAAATAAKGGGGGGGKASRLNLTLRLKVEDIDYTPADESLRVRGKTVDPHEHVPASSYHTADVQLGKALTLYKDEWDEVSYGLVVRSCSIEDKAEVGAVVLEEGVAHICLVTDSMTVLRSKVEKSIPRKRRAEAAGAAGQHDRALDKFYEMVCATMMRHLDVARLKVVVLASPGFTAGALYKHLMAKAAREAATEGGGAAAAAAILANKAKFVVAHSSTGYLQGLEEAMREPSLQARLRDTQFAREAAVFDEFERTLNADDDRAWYGPREAARAAELGAVKYLMITDTLFRSDDVGVRRHYIRLAEQVRRTGGEVLVFSSLHESGEQLNQLTGVAVLLSYPVADLDEEEA
ncbi:Protein DOM34 [[Candida] zeylanoides]